MVEVSRTGEGRRETEEWTGFVEGWYAALLARGPPAVVFVGGVLFAGVCLCSLSARLQLLGAVGAGTILALLPHPCSYVCMSSSCTTSTYMFDPPSPPYSSPFLNCVSAEEAAGAILSR